MLIKKQERSGAAPASKKLGAIDAQSEGKMGLGLASIGKHPFARLDKMYFNILDLICKP